MCIMGYLGALPRLGGARKDPPAVAPGAQGPRGPETQADRPPFLCLSGAKSLQMQTRVIMGWGAWLAHPDPSSSGLVRPGRETHKNPNE